MTKTRKKRKKIIIVTHCQHESIARCVKQVERVHFLVRTAKQAKLDMDMNLNRFKNGN